jgi:hypothetical protein
MDKKDIHPYPSTSMWIQWHPMDMDMDRSPLPRPHPQHLGISINFHHIPRLDFISSWFFSVSIPSQCPFRLRLWNWQTKYVPFWVITQESVESVRIHPYISVLLLCLPGEPKAGDYPSDLVIDKPDEILRLLKLTEGPRHTMKHTGENNTPKRSISLVTKDESQKRKKTNLSQRILH